MTTKTQVAKRDNGALTIPDGNVGMSGQLDQDDVEMPVVSITQPMSQDRGKEGMWWFSDGTQPDKLTVAVLDFSGTRTMWNKAGVEPSIICRSSDRVQGFTDNPELVFLDALPEGVMAGERTSIPCEDCPRFASAGNFERGEDGLWCPKGYTLLLVPLDDLADPFLYFVKGSAVRPVRAKIVSPSIKRYNRTGIAEPWVTPFTMTPREVVQPGKKYWVPEIAALEPLSEDQKAQCRELALQYADRAARQTMEQEPEAAKAEQQPMMPDN